MEKYFNIDYLWTALPVLLPYLWITLLIAALSVFFGTIVGLFLAMAKLSKSKTLRFLANGYTTIIRCTPSIVLLFLVYYGIPAFFENILFIDIQSLHTGVFVVITFSLQFASMMSEVIRSSYEAIDKGQYEAAESLALGYWKTQGLVILPQALKLVIPGLVNTIIALFKDTSLVIIIGLFDLFSSVQQATVDPAWLGMSTEGYVFAALIYWIFCFSMSRYSQHLEKRFNTGRTPH